MEEQHGAKDLSGMLGSLLSNPDQMARLTQLAGTLASSGGLEALLGGMASPNGNGSATEEQGVQKEMKEQEAPRETATAEAPSSVPIAADAVSSDTLSLALARLNGSIGKTHPSKHEALLKALRPYLSKERQMRIDGLLRLISLANVLGTALQATEGRNTTSQTV